MKIYNTQSKKIEKFEPINKDSVSIYVCGPTVYDDVHIGNLRPVVVFDTLKNVLIELGYNVKFVSNYTDVDDKIINRALELNITEKQLTQSTIEAYNKIRDDINASKMYASPKVTETMDEIISFINDLLEKKYAYIADGDVYFDVSQFKQYGMLSNQKLDDLQVGARIEQNTSKKNPLDFVLWKKTDKGIKWQAPFGLGRPGWHTECVVMINSIFSNKIDIHAGGKDLKFPHHENEQIQSIAHNNTELAKYWMHSAMIDVDGIKMSKSLGNFIKAKDILNKLSPMVVRWFLLQTHYRLDINVSDEILEKSKLEYEKIIQALIKSDIKSKLNKLESNEINNELFDEFMDAMKDDLNTPNAITVLFKIVKTLNTLIRLKDEDEKLKEIVNFKNTLAKCLDILGIKYELTCLHQEDIDTYNMWKQFKQNKQFDKADELRNILSLKGIL